MHIFYYASLVLIPLFPLVELSQANIPLSSFSGINPVSIYDEAEKTFKLTSSVQFITIY